MFSPGPPPAKSGPAVLPSLKLSSSLLGYYYYTHEHALLMCIALPQPQVRTCFYYGQVSSHLFGVFFATHLAYHTSSTPQDVMHSCVLGLILCLCVISTIPYETHRNIIRSVRYIQPQFSVAQITGITVHYDSMNLRFVPFNIASNSVSREFLLKCDWHIQNGVPWE